MTAAQPTADSSTLNARAETLPRIEAITVIEVCVPRRERNRLKVSYGELPDAHYALVRVDAEGITGLGEAATDHWWTGEDAASVRHAVEKFLAPALLGRSWGLRDAARQMDAALAENPYAKAAVDMALWDVMGRAHGLPLHVMLGGGIPRPVPIKYVVSIVDRAHALSEVEYARSLGIRWFKMKVGSPDLDGDLERVTAVVEALHPGECVGVDANAGWSHAVARRALPRLADLGVRFIEQPVSPRFPWAMADLTARSAVPILAHESVFTVQDAVVAAHERAADMWAITPGTHGGLFPTLDILSLARAHGISCLLGSTIELGLASAQMVHIGSAHDEIAAGPVPSDIIGPLYHESDVLVKPIDVHDGLAYVPEGPGLGVQLDQERLDHFRVTG
jgi:L-alanine-DL-glutamate epimerase-like enolase superfamily enzyme